MNASIKSIINENIKLSEYDLREDVIDFARLYNGCSCYICDAVSEWADGYVSEYTCAMVRYANNNKNSVRTALLEGLAMSGSEYFRAHPDDDYEDYTAHVGAVAWFIDNERIIYESADSAAYIMAVYDAANLDYDGEFAGLNPQLVYDEIECRQWDLNDFERCDDITDYVRCIACDLMEFSSDVA